MIGQEKIIRRKTKSVWSASARFESALLFQVTFVIENKRWVEHLNLIDKRKKRYNTEFECSWYNTEFEFNF